MSLLTTLQKSLIERSTQRERRWLALALSGLSLVLVWSLLVAPAWRQVSNASAQRQKLDQSLQHMQELALEVARLRADTTPADLKSGTTIQDAVKTHLGMASQTVLAADRATVTLVGVGSEPLAQWLRVVRQNAHAKPIEVHLKKSGPQWGGTIVLALPAKATSP